jgi:hypothetical protein
LHIPWYAESVIVAGTRLTDAEVACLAGKLRDAGMGKCADEMEAASQGGTRLFHIEAQERVAFLRALADCPDELLPLRANLLEQAA